MTSIHYTTLAKKLANYNRSIEINEYLADLKTAFDLMGGDVENDFPKLVYFKLYDLPQFKSQLEQFNPKMSVADVEKIFRKTANPVISFLKLGRIRQNDTLENYDERFDKVARACNLMDDQHEPDLIARYISGLKQPVKGQLVAMIPQFKTLEDVKRSARIVQCLQHIEEMVFRCKHHTRKEGGSSNQIQRQWQN